MLSAECEKNLASPFGFRISLGFRISVFGFSMRESGVHPPHFPHSAIPRNPQSAISVGACLGGDPVLKEGHENPNPSGASRRGGGEPFHSRMRDRFKSSRRAGRPPTAHAHVSCRRAVAAPSAAARSNGRFRLGYRSARLGVGSLGACRQCLGIYSRASGGRVLAGGMRWIRGARASRAHWSASRRPVRCTTLLSFWRLIFAGKSHRRDADDSDPGGRAPREMILTGAHRRLCSPLCFRD